MKVTELSLQVCYQTQPQGGKTGEREVPSITGSLAEAYKRSFQSNGRGEGSNQGPSTAPGVRTVAELPAAGR